MTSTRAAADQPTTSDIGRRRRERRQAGSRRSDARWQEIKNGAARAFLRRGYGQTTLEDVASEVGINRATLYYYVGTKEELLVDLVRAPLSALHQRIEQIAAGGGTASGRLGRALREHAAALAEHPELHVFLAENIRQVTSGQALHEIQYAADGYAQALTRIVTDGVQCGEFRADIPPHLAALGILGMVNWTHRWYRASGPETLVRIGEIFADMALRSLVPLS